MLQIVIVAKKPPNEHFYLRATMEKVKLSQQTAILASLRILEASAGSFTHVVFYLDNTNSERLKSNSFLKRSFPSCSEIEI